MIINEVLKVQDRDQTYYLGTMDPNQILELTYVPCEVQVAALDGVLNVRHVGGYQREGDIKRMVKIKNHYANTLNSLIPPVLLSPRGKWKFTPINSKSNFGTLEAEDCAAVIDGQHRLGGLSLMSADDSLSLEQRARKIPFMAVDFEDEQIEQQQFEIINDEQKGIPKSHLKFINKYSSTIGIVANALREAEDSVFCNRIAIAKRSDSDLVVFATAEDMVTSMFDLYFCQNAFKPDESDENKAKALRIALKYWETVKESFPELWSDIQLMPPAGLAKSRDYPGRNKFKFRLLEETGLKAFAKIGSKILIAAYMTNSGDVSWDTVKDFMTRMSKDPTLIFVFKKKTPETTTALVELDPGLIYQGNAGVPALTRILDGAFERSRRS